MKNKRLLFVFPTKQLGGAEKAAILISEQLENSFGYIIEFAFFDDEDSKIININFKQHFLGGIGKHSKIIDLIFNKPFKLRSLIKERNIDVVFCGYEFDIELILFFTRVYLLFSNLKFVSILQASLKGRNSEASNKRKVLFYFIKKLRNIFFHQIIVVSKTIFNELNSAAQKKSLIIYNPVDHKILNLKDGEIENSIKEFISDRPYMLNVSRYSYQKNLKLLIDAFYLIREKASHSIIIIGSKSDEVIYNELNRQIEKLNIKDRVYLSKPIKNIYPVIKNSALSAFSSLYEGNPLFLLESMFLKKKIVSTRFTGYADLLNENNSYLCNSYNAEEFADCILKAIEDNNTKAECGFANVQNYLSSNIAGMYHQAVKSL